MSEPRVKVGLWVSAALRMADRAGRPGAVLRKGDADAGGVLAVLRARAGVVVLSLVRRGAGEPAWLRATGAEPVEESVAQVYIDRQVGRDPDLWVVEFEAPDLVPPFDAKILLS
jgi:hypothetical protein